MKPSHLAHALAELVSRREITLTELAALTGLNQGTVSRLAGQDRRPDVPTLHALCTLQADRKDGLNLLLAHLRDEINRAGRDQSEIIIDADEADHGDDLRTLAEQSRHDQELAAILHHLAGLARNIQRRIAAGDYPVIETSADHELPNHDLEKPA